MDATHAGRLVAFALDNSAVPGNSGSAGEYRTLVDAYVSDAVFRRLVDDVLEGASCTVIHADRNLGMLLDTEPDGPWAWPRRAADLPWNKNFSHPSARSARLLVPVALLAYIAPSAADFDDLLTDPLALSGTFTAAQLEGFIRDFAQRKEADTHDPAGGEAPAWWHWLQLPAAAPTDQRASRQTTVYLVHEVLSFLHTQGLLAKTSGFTVRDTVYRPRRRFIARCRTLLADELLQQLQEHAARRSEETDSGATEEEV